MKHTKSCVVYIAVSILEVFLTIIIIIYVYLKNPITLFVIIVTCLYTNVSSYQMLECFIALLWDILNGFTSCTLTCCDCV